MGTLHLLALWIGVELMLYGMGLVFLLLAILWGVISLLVRLEPQPGDERRPAPATASAPATVTPAKQAQADQELIAAIVIACRAHRMTRRQQAAPEMRTHEPGTLPSRWLGAGRTLQNRIWARRGRLK